MVNELKLLYLGGGEGFYLLPQPPVGKWTSLGFNVLTYKYGESNSNYFLSML